MNWGRLFTTFIVVFAFIFFYEWWFHGMYMAQMYDATSELWRTEEGMRGLFHWLVMGQGLFALMFCIIFAKGYEAKGVLEGARYGIYIGLLMTAPTLINYAVMPVTMSLVQHWIGGIFIETIIAGILASLIYKK